MVAHCCQLKLESSLSPHLHYSITLKFQTETKNEIDIYYTNSINLILNCIMNLISDRITDFQ